MSSIEINAQFAQVLDFVNRTSRTIFLTGKAGTGKTTLLKHIRANTYKQMAVCAPTGVAAINAGGSTIHSFFQFPFTPFVPRVKENGDIDASAANLPTLKYNSQRLSVFRSLELLVIDEISMVRADLLDQIDITLRYTRKKWQQPFGGVQILLIGDMHQLPPVVQETEWQHLKQHYNTPFFFDSHVMRRYPPVYVELTKVYRQSDDVFIGLLNKVRHNELDTEAHQELNKRYKSDISQEDYAGSITLTTHNRKADEINERNLHALPGRLHSFKAEVKGLFPEKNYPAAEKLELKAGARVMFLKNNSEKNYYNGKIGIVTAVEKDAVHVKCEEDRAEIRVTAEVWSNVSYKMEKATRRIDEEVLGSFTQLPLRHAWAITIHKSQGLTFDRLIIDAAEAFSAGQVYVALSRCRSLEGLTLSSRIAASSLQNDKEVLGFAASRQEPEKLGEVLASARYGYVRDLLYGIFDFTELEEMRKELAGISVMHDKRLDGAARNWLEQLSSLIDNLFKVGLKFGSQLRAMTQDATDPETDQALQDRVKKAAVYFGDEMSKVFTHMKNCGMSIDSKEAASAFNEVLQPLFEMVAVKKEVIALCRDGFVFDEYLKKKLKLVYPATKINVYASAANARPLAGVAHPVLYRELLMLRDEICNEDHKPVYMVAGTKTLTDLARMMPSTPEELLCVPGFGKAKVETYGDRFLELIRNYREENNLTDLLFEMPAKKKKRQSDAPKDHAPHAEKGATREKTVAMFRQGLTPEQIAKERGLVTGTIMSHLVPYVANGEIEIDRLVDPRKQEMISKALVDFKAEEGMGQLKNKLPDEISFAEIRFMLAHQERMKSTA